MDDLKLIFSKNLISLRKSVGLTQALLAEKLNYSDKAISKWERAEAIPDIYMLKQIAAFFSVSLDYLMNEHTEEESVQGTINDSIDHKTVALNHFLIAAVSVIGVWLVAVTTFVILKRFELENTWLCFIYPIPVSFLLSFIFACIWGRKMYRFITLSSFCWSVLLVAFILLNYEWLLFIIGIPIQVIIILSYGINTLKKKENKQKGL